jgi:hypothetical protein
MERNSHSQSCTDLSCGLRRLRQESIDVYAIGESDVRREFAAPLVTSILDAVTNHSHAVHLVLNLYLCPALQFHDGLLTTFGLCSLSWQSAHKRRVFSSVSDPPTPRPTICARCPLAHPQIAPHSWHVHLSRRNTLLRSAVSASPLRRTRPSFPGTPERIVTVISRAASAAPHRTGSGPVDPSALKPFCMVSDGEGRIVSRGRSGGRRSICGLEDASVVWRHSVKLFPVSESFFQILRPSIL